MAWWVMLIIVAASMVLSGLLQKAPKVKASSLGEFEIPTAEEGRSLPVIWGTCCLRAPNVVWYGDYKSKAIKKSMGIMAFGRTYTAGHKYYLGMDLGLCHGPVDALVDILAGTGEDLKPLSFSGGENISSLTGWYLGQQEISPAPSQNPDGSLRLFTTSRRNIFNQFFSASADSDEGNIEGWGTFYYGSDTQGSDPYMSAKLGITYPAYRRVCHMVCDQWYVGNSPYIKNLAYVLRRCPSHLGLSGAQTNINGDANPAEIIYECLQMKSWGLGFPGARFDLASFASAGATLASEGFGMSLQADNPQQADKVIETVLQHIDGVCYTDPSTGLWTLKLVRPDYVPAAVPVFDENDIAECEFSRGSWEDTLNEVKVTYTDRGKWKQGMVQAQEPANFAIRNGELSPVTINFPGFSSATVAQKACNRELRTHSYPIGQGRIKVNRKAWALRMGSPFRLTWPPLGITDMCVRVTSIDYGSLTDGMIEAEICEDVFRANYTAYSAPSGSSWTDPVGDPAAPAAQLALEAPYQMLDGVLAPRVMVGAVRADGSSSGFQVWADEGAGYLPTNGVPDFCPGGLLQSAYSRKTAALDTAGFVLTGMDLEDLVSTDATGRDRGDNLLYFADTGEICAWQTVTNHGDGTFTISGVVRGIYDTLPADHAAGTRVIFIRNGGSDLLTDYRASVLEGSDEGEDSILLND